MAFAQVIDEDKKRRKLDAKPDALNKPAGQSNACAQPPP
jgi:hypothetical protein